MSITLISNFATANIVFFFQLGTIFDLIFKIISELEML